MKIMAIMRRNESEEIENGGNGRKRLNGGGNNGSMKLSTINLSED